MPIPITSSALRYNATAGPKTGIMLNTNREQRGETFDIIHIYIAILLFLFHTLYWRSGGVMFLHRMVFSYGDLTSDWVNSLH